VTTSDTRDARDTSDTRDHCDRCDALLPGERARQDSEGRACRGANTLQC
jgi:hypothetical protein